MKVLFLHGLQRNHGGILNVGSTAGFQPGSYMTVYYATKAYVLSFTEALAEELAGTAIKVTCLAPGATATGFKAAANLENSLLFRPGAMDAKTVAALGYREFRRGKVIVIPGLKNKLGAFTGPNGTPKFLTFKSVEETIRLCVKTNGCPETPTVADLPDNIDDGTTAKQKTFGPGTDGAEVVLVEIEGGGHTWPGQEPPVRFIGKSTKDISANDLMWAFFQKHPMK